MVSAIISYGNIREKLQIVTEQKIVYLLKNIMQQYMFNKNIQKISNLRMEKQF